MHTSRGAADLTVQYQFMPNQPAEHNSTRPSIPATVYLITTSAAFPFIRILRPPRGPQLCPPPSIGSAGDCRHPTTTQIVATDTVIFTVYPTPIHTRTHIPVRLENSDAADSKTRY